MTEPSLQTSFENLLIALRAERRKQVGTRAERAARMASIEAKHRQTLFRAPCATREPNCLGGQLCMHSIYLSFSRSAMIASVHYDYGISTQKRREMYNVIASHMILHQMPVSLMHACGITAELLVFVGFNIETFCSNGYLFEDVCEKFEISWPLMRMLGFNGALANNGFSYPPIVLYDALGVRNKQWKAINGPMIGNASMIFSR